MARSIDKPRLSIEATASEQVNSCSLRGIQTLNGSSSLYGSSGNLPKREDHPVNPESPYALTKYWTEELAMQFSEFYHLDTVALCYFNVFGPRQDPESDYAAVVPTFARLILNGERPTIYGDDEQSRDFTYVENVLQANYKAATSDVGGEMYNVACGGRVTVNEFIDELNDVLGTDIEPRYDDPRPGDVKHSHADIDKARADFGYEPTVQFREGLERTVEALQQEEVENTSPTA